MKRFGIILTAAACLVLNGPQLLAEPVLTLTLRGFNDVEQAVGRLATTLGKEGEFNFRQLVGGALGFTEATWSGAVDLSRPWQAAVWYDGVPASPLIAVKIPAADLAKFKDSLLPESLLVAQAKNWETLAGGVISLTLTPTEAMSPGQKSEWERWKTGALRAPRPALELTTLLSEPLRAQAAAGLRLGQAAMSQTFANSSQLTPGLDPALMGSLFGVYFDIIDTVLQGLQEVRIGLDVTAEAVTLEDLVTAKPGSVLATWLNKPKNPIVPALRRMMDPSGLASFGGTMGDEPSMMGYLNRLIGLGFQLQSTAPDDPLVGRVEALMKSMFPLQFAASVGSGKGVTFGGAYAFPASDPSKVYADIKAFVQNDMKAMVGPEKMYLAADFKEKHRTLDGVAIDRLTIVINTNSPLMQVPGQQEQLAAFWPGGRMEFDYALVDGHVLFASPDRTERTLASIKGGAISSGTLPWDDSTAWAGFVNMVEFMKFSIAFNAMVPEEVKTQVASMNSAGTAMEFRVNLDQRLQTDVRVPLKFLQEMRKLEPQN